MRKFSLDKNTKISDLNIYKKRIKKINLKWVQQIVKIIKSRIQKKKIFLNDLGCNTFQLYKGLRNTKLNRYIFYRGYDHEKEYINLGLKYFPELKKRNYIIDIQQKTPKISDVTVISATLEHLYNPEKTINSICKSTKELIIIRTFLGNKKIRKLFKNKKYVDRPYFINQFKVSWIKKKLESFNFKNIEIIKDNATKGKVRSIYPGLKRKFSIIVAKK
tara:strand:- start:136 stop:789 length:654 start_codon:yes stop_codon:yes gene_type:complete